MSKGIRQLVSHYSWFIRYLTLQINHNQVTCRRNSSSYSRFHTSISEWFSFSHEMQLGNSLGSDCWCNLIAWENYFVTSGAWTGRQCVKSRMCFHRVLPLNCFASVYVCDFQRINQCVCEKEAGSGLSSKRKCLPLWTQWRASSLFMAARQLNN